MGFADIMKNGWHPEKSSGGGTSSSSAGSSGGLKSFGLGKFTGAAGSSTSSSNDQSTYRTPSKPISELTDAKLFPPPPKHREYHPDAGSAAISPEYAYLYQPAMERKRQEEQRQQQQQQWRQTWQPGQTPQYQPPGQGQPQYQPPGQGQPQYQQPGPVPQHQAPTYQQPGQSAYQPPVAAQPGYQPPQPTYQSPAQAAYQQPQSHQMAQQTYQPPTQPIPSARSPPLPQRGPMPSLPPRNVASPGYQQPAYQPRQPQPQQPPAPAYQSPQQPPGPTYQPTATPSYQQTPQPFVRGHGYSQSVADGRPDSVSPPPISQPTPTYPNFASEISRARAGLSSTSPASAPALAPTGQRVPSGHRQTQSMSIVGKKAPPPPPKPKNPALRGSPASPVAGQSAFPGAFPGAFPEQNGHAESNVNNNTDTRNGHLPVHSAKPGLQDSSNGPAKPPPLATRPAVTPRPAVPAAADSQQTQQWAPPQVDLELDKRWYAMGTNPTKLLQLPSFVFGLTHTYAVAVGGNTKTIVLCVRFADLSRTKFRIEVDRYDDKNVSAQRVDFPPPARPGASELDAAASGFGENVAKFVEANVGRQIGDGECWTAASEALRFSGAMPSCGFVHGPAMWTFDAGTGARTGDDAMLRRGDILQFKNARFRKLDPSAGGGGRVVEDKYVGAPDHTAVVVAVHAFAPAVVVTVLEQNVAGVRTVQQGSYEFGDMTAGAVAAYRPFWKEWAGELETSWP
ncbi:hypothetical protein V1517DRAFT_177169 [Lipomyces orientalis]|uniref:Uncharacterized protein n=1 Tax=Lipomyces orientalis TaxID=1233043 RepID=A0ACC3TXP7_9ASCO